MLESETLSYCNQKADSFFGVSLSGLSKDTLNSCQYQVMSNRCMHELKTSYVDQVAAKMENDDSASQLIEEVELGKNVLTLQEVTQTFDVESAMFNIKLEADSENYRTVVLTKNNV